MRSAGLAVIAALVVSAVACVAQAVNPITNGGFEQVGPDGVPVDWSIVGVEVSVTGDAHSGNNAVLMSRTQEAIDRRTETGLNRAWTLESGEQGKMLAERKGGVKFWYKVPSAPADAHLRFYMIPMSADPLENTGSQRAFYEVPGDHFGDGQWHQGMLAYDFTDNDKCKWVHVSPRVLSEEPAQWIIDDVEWLESVGPLPSLSGLALREVKGREGREATVSVRLENTGDEVLSGEAELVLPEYLQAAEPGLRRTIGPLRPGDSVKLEWRVTGQRDREAVIRVRATGGAAPASASLSLKADLAEAWLEADRFILWPGEETTVSLVVENNGTAAAHDLRASLKVPSEMEVVGKAEAGPVSVAPGARERVAFRVRARGQTPGAWVTCSWQAGADRDESLESEIIIGAKPPKHDAAPDDAARVGSSTFDIIFPRNEFGYGIGWIYTRPGGDLLGALPYLGRVVIKARDSMTVNLYAASFERETAVTPLGATRADLERGKPVGVAFQVRNADLERLGLRGPITISLASGVGTEGSGTASKTITYQVSCAAPQSPLLLALEGPMVCLGEGAGGGELDEALYPGLEWLVKGEESSSTLDIAADHPHRLRYVAHPHMVTIPCMGVRRGRTSVGLLWHARARWASGENRPDLAPDASDVDRPSAIFACPDKPAGHGCEAMGLFVPTVPEYVEANERMAERPWPAAGVRARDIKLVSAIYVNPESDSAMDTMRAWFDIYGVVSPGWLPHTKAGKPGDVLVATQGFRGDGLPTWALAADRKGVWLPVEPSRQAWVDEVDWSMQAYLKTLWDEEEQGWMAYKGGPQLTQSIGPHGHYLYDCVLGARLTSDPALRRELEDRISLVKSLYPWARPQADDMGFNFGSPVGALTGMSEDAQGLARSQDPDGGWRFHPYVATSGVFKGQDYGELGYEGQEANGLVARRAWTLLRYSRMTGDQAALDAGLKALRYMDKFIVPRAAQVWEVPVHTPDILASSDACEAYLEAYEITGDRQWLNKAVYWEETGLPFLYQWDVDEYPWMRYGSIPVFGATWFRGSWFGRPVQWNGLRWAFAALKLAAYDNTYPWKQLAEGVTVSAMYQQADDPENEHDFALWPDSIYTLDASKSGWIFAPRAILKNVYKILGYEPEPVTVQAKVDGGTAYVTACGALGKPELADGALRFTVGAPLPTRILVCAVDEPTTVKLNGGELPKREGLPGGDDVVGWIYHGGASIVEISPGKPGDFTVEVTPAKYRACKLAPEPADRIAFEFERDDEGWRPTHDLGPFSVEKDVLRARVIGADPYMVRSNCTIDGDTVSRIHVRSAATAGTVIQFFWATQAFPQMAEERKIEMPIIADGEFHDYYFDVGKHELWPGQTITSLRLDPTGGASDAEVRVDFIRGE